MISVIIPTYKSTEHLDLCLRSALEGQVNDNQIIVVVDGTMNVVKPILDKYREEHIQVLDLEVNQGLCRATNYGVYNAKHEKILIVNDDNVFPLNWDRLLLSINFDPGFVFSPNQVEPNPSMFSQFIIRDMGKTPSDFNLTKWFTESSKLETINHDIDLTGYTLPIFMYKTDYLKVGGWDENYPRGMVADWDFFLKCSLVGYQMWRTYMVPFYHFTSASVNSYSRQIAEGDGHAYAKYKWGTNIKHNPITNQKYL